MTFRIRRIFYLFSIVALASACSLPAHAWWGSKKRAQEKAGAALFYSKGCSHCHGADLQGKKNVPSIANIRKDKSWTPERITGQILHGGKKMPPFADSLTDQDISDLVAFLRARHRPAPPATASAAE
ncbi:MAG TPA: cytochrome c [Terracidiphilus sp.]|nr:cytochrome c [Terracidiphilus sp.]